MVLFYPNFQLKQRQYFLLWTGRFTAVRQAVPFLRFNHGLLRRDVVNDLSLAVNSIGYPFLRSNGRGRTANDTAHFARTPSASTGQDYRARHLLFDGSVRVNGYDCCELQAVVTTLRGLDDATCPFFLYRFVFFCFLRGCWGDVFINGWSVVFVTAAFSVRLPRCPHNFRLVAYSVLSLLPSLPRGKLLIIFVGRASTNVAVGRGTSPSIHRSFGAFFGGLMPSNTPCFIRALRNPSSVDTRVGTSLVKASIDVPVQGRHLGLKA